MAPIDIVQTEVGVATAEQDIINAEATVGLAGRPAPARPELRGHQPTTSDRSDRRVESREAGFRPRGGRAHRPGTAARDHGAGLHGRERPAASTTTGRTRPCRSWTSSRATARTGCRELFSTNRGSRSAAVTSHDNWFDAADQLFTENFRNWRVGFVFSYPILNRSAKGARGVAEFNLETERPARPCSSRTSSSTSATRIGRS